MAITLAQTRGNTGYTASLAIGRSTTAGNTLVVAVTHQAATTASVSDSAGNTWVEAANAGLLVGNSDRRNSIFVCVNADAVNTITVTTSGTSALLGWFTEWEGVGSLRGGDAASIAFGATKRLTIEAEAGDLVIAAIGAYNVTPTASAGWTELGNQNVSTTNHNAAYQLVTSDGPTGPQWSGSSDTVGLTIVALAPETSPEAGFELVGSALLETETVRDSSVETATESAVSVDTETGRPSVVGTELSAITAATPETSRPSATHVELSTLATLEVETEARPVDVPAAGFDLTTTTNVDAGFSRRSTTQTELATVSRVDVVSSRDSATGVELASKGFVETATTRQSVFQTELPTATEATVGTGRASSTDVTLHGLTVVEVEARTVQQGLQVENIHAVTVIEVGFTANRPRPLNVDRLMTVPTENRFLTPTDQRYMTVPAETRFHTVQPG